MGAHSELLKQKKSKSPSESKDQREDRERRTEMEEGEKNTNSIDIPVFPKNDAKCNAWLKNSKM